jgi:hypothetical protein
MPTRIAPFLRKSIADPAGCWDPAAGRVGSKDPHSPRWRPCALSTVGTLLDTGDVHGSNEEWEMQVKFFSRVGLSGSYKPGHHQDLENEVNEWLAANPDISVVDISLSVSGGSFNRPQVFVSVIYERAE